MPLRRHWKASEPVVTAFAVVVNTLPPTKARAVLDALPLSLMESTLRPPSVATLSFAVRLVTVPAAFETSTRMLELSSPAITPGSVNTESPVPTGALFLYH